MLHVSMPPQSNGMSYNTEATEIGRDIIDQDEISQVTGIILANQLYYCHSHVQMWTHLTELPVILVIR